MWPVGENVSSIRVRQIGGRTGLRGSRLILVFELANEWMPILGYIGKEEE